MNSLLVETRVKSTLYALILYWSGARHWVGLGEVVLLAHPGAFPANNGAVIGLSNTRIVAGLGVTEAIRMYRI